MIYIVSSKNYGDIQAYESKCKAIQDINEWKVIDKANLVRDIYTIRKIKESDLKFLKLLNGYEIIGKVKGVYDKKKGDINNE